MSILVVRILLISCVKQYWYIWLADIRRNPSIPISMGFWWRPVLEIYHNATHRIYVGHSNAIIWRYCIFRFLYGGPNFPHFRYISLGRKELHSCNIWENEKIIMHICQFLYKKPLRGFLKRFNFLKNYILTCKLQEGDWYFRAAWERKKKCGYTLMWGLIEHIKLERKQRWYKCFSFLVVLPFTHKC